MPDKELSDLTAASALALADQLYITQSGNSRRGTMQQVKNAVLAGGWVKISDAATAAEVDAKTYLTDTRTQLTLDGGSGTVLSYGGTVGTDLADWWASNKHISKAEGETYNWRITFKAKKSSGSVAYVTMEQDIGGSVGVITARDFTLRKASGVEHDSAFSWSGYALDTYLANGATFYLTATADIEIWQPELFIQRTYVPGVPA